MREEATVMLGESQPKTRGLRGQLSHSPTHWQTFFTRPTLRLLRNRFPGDVPLARTRAFRYSPLCPKGSTQTVLHCAHRGGTFSSCGLGEQEGWSGCSPPIILRPRVARAPKIIRLHPRSSRLRCTPDGE